MKARLFFITTILFLSSTIAIGQGTDKSKTSFGLLGGVNFQTLNGKNMSGGSMENDMIIGYHVGVNVQMPIAPEFYIQPGLLFTTKGAKNTEGLITITYSLSYLEVPLNFVYKGSLGNGFIMIGFGPYAGYAIGGKVKYEGGSASLKTDIEFKNPVESGDSMTKTYFKAFDAGGNIFAGYEMASGIFIQLNTQIGMIKINPEDNRYSNDESVIKNTGFGFSIGYRL